MQVKQKKTYIVFFLAAGDMVYLFCGVFKCIHLLALNPFPRRD